MTWELLGEDRQKEYLEQAREAAKALREECEHETTFGEECLEQFSLMVISRVNTIGKAVFLFLRVKLCLSKLTRNYLNID